MKGKAVVPPTGERMWVIRAGRKGEANDLFVEHCIIVLDDPGMGDLRELEASRQAFYRKYREMRPHETRTGTAGIGGKFHRFIHEVRVGDFVIYPSLKDHKLHIGRIEGDYVFSLEPNKKFPHHRAVAWLCSVPKSDVTESARRELGAARTFFQLKKHTDELRRFLEKKKLTKQATERDA